MGFFTFLLLILFLYFVLRPIIKVAMTYRKMRRGDFSFINDIFGTPGAQQPGREADGSHKAGWTKPVRKKKKISPDTGEYVKFTEVTTTREQTSEASSSDAGTTTQSAYEQQITDVEWEDIK